MNSPTSDDRVVRNATIDVFHLQRSVVWVSSRGSRRWPSMSGRYSACWGKSNNGTETHDELHASSRIKDFGAIQVFPS